MKALEAPLFHIAANAGLEGSVIINKVKESKVGIGFDAYKEEYVDMVKAGILDPAKVTRSALQNATSVASTLLTTESVVSIIPEEAPAAPATKICPYCMSEIPIAATRCAYCTSELPAEDTDKEE